MLYSTYYFKSLESTNSKAKEMADNGAGSGTAVVAEYQTKGRGRLGKDWHSVAGKGLYCSIIIRPDLDPIEFPKITLVAGVAVSIVLDKVSNNLTQLKWPNDIYISGKKCGGILTESSPLTSSDASPYVVIGIGINVGHELADFPLELQKMVTSVFIETGIKHSIDDLLQTIRKELLFQIERFEDEGFQSILNEWRRKDFLLGKRMECVDTSGKIIEGVALGPDDSGQLHVRSDDGRIHEVLSGDVRLASR